MNWKDFKKLPKSDRIELLKTMTEDEKKKLRKQRDAAMWRKEKDDIMKDMGLTKVRGAVSGKVYWE